MSDPVIRCSDLTKRFGSVVAVSGLNLTVRPGEIVSILGPSGCGKTTLLRLIAGFEVPTAGIVEIQGARVSSNDQTAPPDKRGVGMVVQEYALFPHLTVERNIAFGLKNLPQAERRDRVGEVLDLVRLEGYGPRYPSELSGGQQQRVALARTLAPNPVTVLLDEPFSNLDSSMRQRLRLEVEDILRPRGTAAIFVTHDREEAFAIADTVGVMVEGRLLQVDTPERIYHFPTTPDVARLTGTCDFVDGVINGDGSVETELGVISPAPQEGALSNGSRVRVLLHPDDLAVTPGREGRGVVVSREFRGDEVILRVKLESGAVIRTRLRSFSTLPAGSRVHVSPIRDLPFAVYAD